MLLTINNNSQLAPSSVNTKEKKKYSVTNKSKEITTTPPINNLQSKHIPRKLSTTKRHHQQQQQERNDKTEEDRKFMELERANKIKQQPPLLDNESANQNDGQQYFDSTKQCKLNTGISQSNERIDDSDQSKSTATSATLPRDDWPRCSLKQDILKSTKNNESKVSSTPLN